jgi:mono/diheme cytochrome c family protein
MRARLCELYILGQNLLIAQFLAAGFTANAQTEASTLRGRDVAQRACAGCHA